MLEKMIFGRFIPGTSFVHRLDPRSKLTFVFLFIVAVFLANNTATYAILLGFTLLVIFSSRIRLYFLLNGLKPILFLIVFTFLMHIFFTKEGALLLDWKFIKIYEEGLRQGIFISIRFLVLGSNDVDADIDDISDFNHGWYGRFVGSFKRIQITSS